ncbi:MAG: GNAT family N-acetyltransferase [Panacibacter sp.]
MDESEKLDNPVWYSLSEHHKSIAIHYGNIKFYHPDYCPFGGFKAIENISTHLAEYSALTDNFFIVGDKPDFSDPLKLKNELVCLQMIAPHKIGIDITEDIKPLTKKYKDELLQLVNLVQPGYFKTKTSLLGNYYGILKDNQLIAVTGERMQMNKYVEVSAVVTHPNHAGKGYAKQLIAVTVNNIFAQNKIPYLHVAETNSGAIWLYEKLGFTTRRQISFWNITR